MAGADAACLGHHAALCACSAFRHPSPHRLSPAPHEFLARHQFKCGHSVVYSVYPEMYRLLVARQDVYGNIERVLHALLGESDRGLDIIDIGAGTGRLSLKVVPYSKSLRICEGSAKMLDIARADIGQVTLDGGGAPQFAVLNNYDIADSALCAEAADVLLCGWTLSYIVSDNWEAGDAKWMQKMVPIMDKLKGALRPGGKLIVFETMGTGIATPTRMGSHYYHFLCSSGLQFLYWIHTDYLFHSREEAQTLSLFFFGKGIRKIVDKSESTLLPECTGVWCFVKE